MGVEERPPAYKPAPYPSGVPISAPVWLWVLYFGMILLFAVGGTIAKIYPFYPVLFTAAFSFQFWAYAIWNGYRRDYEEFQKQHNL